MAQLIRVISVIRGLLICTSVGSQVACVVFLDRQRDIQALARTLMAKPCVWVPACAGMTLEGGGRRGEVCLSSTVFGHSNVFLFFALFRGDLKSGQEFDWESAI